MPNNVESQTHVKVNPCINGIQTNPALATMTVMRVIDMLDESTCLSNLMGSRRIVLNGEKLVTSLQKLTLLFLFSL